MRKTAVKSEHAKKAGIKIILADEKKIKKLHSDL